MKKGILRKIIGCTLALSMSMATFAACAGKKDKNAQKPTTNTQQSNNGGSVTPNPNPNPTQPDPSKYKITVACQTEMGEEEVLQVLAAYYEEKNPAVDVEIKTFSEAEFEQFMLNIAAEPSSSPNIIWTTSNNHHWDEYFTDLRPYYEATEGADYSLYYETMLDAASPNGYFKPTKNYKGEFRKDDLDVNSDGFEGYENQSEYGLYYAPRDYNKPAILCNTYLFKELDESYETLYKEVNSVTEMPYDYLSATARLQQIQNGEDWDSLDDLSAFARMLAEKIDYILNNTTDIKDNRKWIHRAVMDLSLEWEPVYTTIMNELNVDLIGEDGKLTLENYESTLEALHEKMFPSDNEDLNIYETEDGEFLSGNLMMTVGSRPVVLGYTHTLEQMYGEKSLAAIPFPVANIAASGSGYAISSLWDGQGMTVNGVYKSYNDLSWDFIKFMISEEGQEIAGSTGLNVPVLKQLCSAETNGGKEPAWRTADSLGDINHDAWVAGGELRQDTFNVFIASRRNNFRFRVREFFMGFQQSDYAEGSLQALIDTTVRQYNLHKPESYLR